MIVNIVGPPAVGKSSYISQFVLERPYWTYVDIDWCRSGTNRIDRSFVENEKAAWKFFEDEVLDGKDVIMESTGLHWVLPSVLLKAVEKKDHYIMNVYFHDNRRQMLKERIKTRRMMNPLPLPFRLKDELDMVDKVIDELWDWKDNLPGTWDIIHMEMDEVEVLQNLTESILERRLTFQKE